VTFVIAGAASMGFPLFSGFIAELQVLIGAWKAYPTFTVIAGCGILIGVAYTLRAIQKAFFGEDIIVEGMGAKHSDAESHGELDPISVPERFGAVLLIGASLVIGVYPNLLLKVIVPSLNSPLFEGLRKVGGP